MPMRCTRLVAATSLLTMSISATAATVVVQSFLVTQSGVQPTANIVLNAAECTTGSTSSTECVHILKNIEPGSPLTDTGTVATVRSVFDAGNVSQVPNFVMNGNARAFASLGQLHASTFVQIQGQGGNNVSIGGLSFAQLTDRVSIESSVLPVGTTVSIKVLMNVSGQGGGRLSFGLNQFNQQVDVASDLPSGALEDYGTTFTAKVGDELRVNYGLAAFTRMVSNGWGAGAVLNGRNNYADYGNSAYLHMGGLDPAQGITVRSDTGYIYPATSAVPEPALALLFLSGLPLLAWRARKTNRGARGGDFLV